MQLRVGPSAPRLVGVLVGVLAVACQLGAVLAIWINLGVNTDVTPLLPWVQRLWAVGSIAAVLALVLGLTADRRGPTIPLALLALLPLRRCAARLTGPDFNDVAGCGGPVVVTCLCEDELRGQIR